MTYERFSVTLLLTTLIVVCFLMSFVIYLIVSADVAKQAQEKAQRGNSTHIIQKILKRLDQINNTTLKETAYQLMIQKAILGKVIAINHSSILLNTSKLVIPPG